MRCATCVFDSEPMAGPCACCEAPEYAMWLSKDFSGLRDVWIEISQRLMWKRRQLALFEVVR